MVNKHILVSLIMLCLVFSCQTMEETGEADVQELLLECLIKVAIESDQTFDSKKHYLSVTQENRLDITYNTLSLQKNELSDVDLSSGFYESKLNEVVILFYYLNNLGDRVERRIIDSFMISNQLVWREVPFKAKNEYSSSLWGVIYDPRINVNLLYDTSSKCIVDSIMSASLGIDSLIKNRCNLCLH